MRVIAGKYRSRPLQSMRGMDLRPTSDRLRETLFNVLCSGDPTSLEGTTWMDIFAGTGAVGIEALSRGANPVHFVESSAAAATLILKNLAALKIKSNFELHHADALLTLRKLETSGNTVDFVFLDPPYSMEEVYRNTLDLLSRSRLLKDNAIVIAEHSRKFDPGAQFGNLHRFRELEQGDSALSFYRMA
jgi:16S rRNA (guanine966-N2)-methyltransferase